MRRTPIQGVSAVHCEEGAKRRGDERLDRQRTWEGETELSSSKLVSV